jgi:DNA repair protein RecO (recombination protein O)
MLNLLHRHDPQPEIYSVYSTAIGNLNAAGDVAATLRRFEMDALSLLGYALMLDREALTGEDLKTDARYEYRVEQGPVAGVAEGGPMAFTGAELEAIGRQDFADPATLTNAGRLLRHVITWHLDGRELQSRKVLRDMRRVADHRTP